MSELTVPWPSRRLWLIGLALSVLVALGLVGAGVALGRRSADASAPDAAYAAALIHAHTRQLASDRDSLMRVAAAAEIVYVKQRGSARDAVANIGKATTAGDSIKALVTAVAKQGDALDAADRLPPVHHAVEAADTLVTRSTEDERDAWKAAAERRPPRTSGSAAFLYDPIAHVPAVSLQAGVRVAGNWSAIARADQRFAPGERPRGYLGASLAF